MKKVVGIVGLGKMGANLARHVHKAGWRVVAYNRTESVTRGIEEEGIEGAYSYPELVKALAKPRVIILMVPAGDPVDEVLFGSKEKPGLAALLSPGDTIIDGGNSFYLDAQPRHEKLKREGIHFVDVGISGGPAGALNGACLMIGGEREVSNTLIPLFTDMSAPDAFRIFPGVGAGHFVKMVHNGIEYGMMQAIAEGFAILKESPFNLDLEKVTEIYNNGSVIESRLIGWLKSGYEAYNQELDAVSPTVQQTGEGMWTVETANNMGISVPIIEGSVAFRTHSAENPSYIGRVLSLLRNQFGGHKL